MVSSWQETHRNLSENMRGVVSKEQISYIPPALSDSVRIINFLSSSRKSFIISERTIELI